MASYLSQADLCLIRYYFDLQQEDLVVTKKQPNVLDKPKSSQGGGGKPQQNNGAGAATSQDVDVRKLTVRFEKLLTGKLCVSNFYINLPQLVTLFFTSLQMVVMDEVHKQMGEIAAKQKERIDEMGAEIRKLKAMIVKHESRIRTLETKNRDLESQVTRGGAGGSGISYNNGDHDDDMDPDEV